MKTPSWAMVVGIMMVVFGGCGVNSGVELAKMPQMLEVQKELLQKNIAEEAGLDGDSLINAKKNDKPAFKNLEELVQTFKDSAEASRAASYEPDSSLLDSSASKLATEQEKAEMFGDLMGSMFYFSDYMKSWLKTLGYLGGFVSLLYLMAGVFMFSPKNYSIPLAYGALACSVAFGLFSTYIWFNDDSAGMISSFAKYKHLPSIGIDLVLMLVIKQADKSFFKKQEDQNDLA